ncbi:MAG: hypothetical protein KY447_00125 [Actinobacteria bacterium]|nr:hypothetical protein [Actinomycetota bacterium]
MNVETEAPARIESPPDPTFVSESTAPAGQGTSSSLAGAAVALAAVAWVAFYTLTSFFFFDDYIYFREAQSQGLSIGFLLQPLNLHLAPGHRIADWALQTLAPLDFGVAQALLLACLGGSVLVVFRILTTLFEPGLGSLALTFLYGTSVVHVGVTQWWSAGLQSLPSGLLSLVCILTWLHFVRTGSRRAIAVSVLSLAAALLFYVKPVLVPLYLVLLRVLVVEPDRSLRASVVETAREWRTWLLYLAPVTLYALVYVGAYWQPSSTPSLGLLAEFLTISWQRVFVPSVLGFSLAPGSQAGGGETPALAGQLVVLAIMAVTIARSRRAWRGWAFLVVAFMANALLVGVPRIADWGTGIAYFYRYYPEVTFIVPIALGAVFLRVRKPGSTDGDVELRSFRRHLPARTYVLVVALAAHLIVASATAEEISDASPGRQAKPYIDNVRSDLARLDEAGIRPAIVDGVVPDFVVASWAVYGPPFQNRHSEVLSLIDPTLRFDRADGPLFEVADDGRLTPVALVPVAGGWAPRLFQEGTLRTSGTTTEGSGDGLCVRASGSTTPVELRPSSPLSGENWYLVLQVRTQQPLSVSVDRGSGYGSIPDHVVAVEDAAGDRLVKLGGPHLQGVRIDVPTSSSVCFGRLEIGLLAPGG